MFANVTYRCSQFTRGTHYNRPFTCYQFHNRALWIAITFSAFCVVNIIYNPLVAPYFGTRGLTITDWLFAVGAAVIFVLARELQRHANKHHTRQQVADLYHQQFSGQKA